MNENTYENTLLIEEDPNTKELYLTFDPALLNQMGWVEDDLLEWTIEGETAVIKKA